MTRSIHSTTRRTALATAALALASSAFWATGTAHAAYPDTVSYTHLRAHET